MKKRIIIFSSLVFFALTGMAQQTCDTLHLNIGYIDPSGTVKPMPKAPVRPPQAVLDNCILFLIGAHSDYTLCLIDENEDVIYTTYVPASVSSVALPSYLSGTYEIRLLTDSVYFYGWITL